MRIDQKTHDILNRIEGKIKHPHKKVKKNCVVCGNKIVKDFIEAEYDFTCQDCLNDMKELTTDFNEPLPKWIVMDPEVVRKMLIINILKRDFPKKYEKLEYDFRERK